MNQILKDMVYHLGTPKQVDFIAELGGMDEEEKRIFKMMHDKKTDLFIQEEIGVSKNGYSCVEDVVRSKFRLAVFDCINYRMEHFN